MDPAATLLQPGVADGSSVGFGVLAAVSLLAALWVYRDASRRASDRAVNWAISVFLFGMLYFFSRVVGLGLYREVREEFGALRSRPIRTTSYPSGANETVRVSRCRVLQRDGRRPSSA